MTLMDRVARLRITLDDAVPPIWRTVEVPLTITLRGLHDVIQAAVPFLDYHLFQFEVGGQRYAIPDPKFDGRETRNTKSTKLGSVLVKGATTLRYTCDFGDDWRHTITVEEVFAADPLMAYPRFVEGARRAPPEDVGGVWGFEEFLNAIVKPRHPERKRMLEWCGGAFDPAEMDVATVQARMIKLANRREAGKAGYAKSVGRVQ